MLRATIRTYREAYSGLSRELWLLSLAMVINRAGGMVLPFLALYLTNDRGLTVGGAGQILALYGIGAIGGSFIGGWAADHIGATRTQQLSLLLGGVGYFWISFLTSVEAILYGARIGTMRSTIGAFSIAPLSTPRLSPMQAMTVRSVP